MDTSKLGPIRFHPPATSNRARNLLADKIARKGPMYLNTAEAVRSGFLNLWLEPALSVIEDLLAQLPDEDE
jgi:hypothetical protein